MKSIPNIIHFIWFTGPKSRDFSLVNYIAVRAAYDIQKPKAIYVHYNEEPKDNPHWEAIKPYVTLVQVDPPIDHYGVELTYPQYQADVVRLRVLAERGGIYLDTDTLLIKPLLPFLRHQCVMSPDQADEPKGMNAGLIMAAPKAPFIEKWLETIRITDTWAGHAVAEPWKLYQEDQSLVHLRPAEEFIPFAYGDDAIFGDDMAWTDTTYAVHMWETYWHTHRQPLDEAYFATHDNAFTRLFRKYLWRLKIAVYAIAKNEQQFVGRFCAAAKDADLIFVADTGSTDNTVNALKEEGATVAHISIDPWRFDDARNAALALLPKDIDVCVSLDLDEVLQPRWREEIERVWTKGTTRLRYGFDWGLGIVFKYEKIHARRGYRWRHPCHEYPVPDRIEEIWANTDMLMVIHQPDSSKSRGQYLDLLRLSIEEDPRDPRNAFYYARELSFHGHWVEAIVQAMRYLDLPGATWANERCYAARVISRSYLEMGQHESARPWLHFGCKEAPDTREPWVELAQFAHDRAEWPLCYEAATKALAITNREWVYTVDPQVWGSLPHDLASCAAWWLDKKDDAIRHLQDAIALDPGNERLIANLHMMQPQACVISPQAA